MYLLVLGAAFVLMLDGALLLMNGVELCEAFVLIYCVASLDRLRLALFILLQGRNSDSVVIIINHNHKLGDFDSCLFEVALLLLFGDAFLVAFGFQEALVRFFGRCPYQLTLLAIVQDGPVEK